MLSEDLATAKCILSLVVALRGELLQFFVVVEGLLEWD